MTGLLRIGYSQNFAQYAPDKMTNAELRASKVMKSIKYIVVSSNFHFLCCPFT